MTEHGIIVADGDSLAVFQNLDKQLERVAADIGATMRVNTRIERHQQEREAWQFKQRRDAQRIPPSPIAEYKPDGWIVARIAHPKYY